MSFLKLYMAGVVCLTEAVVSEVCTPSEIMTVQICGTVPKAAGPSAAAGDLVIT